jgi:hypothetical protein
VLYESRRWQSSLPATNIQRVVHSNRAEQVDHHLPASAVQAPIDQLPHPTNQLPHRTWSTHHAQVPTTRVRRTLSARASPTPMGRPLSHAGNQLDQGLTPPSWSRFPSTNADAWQSHDCSYESDGAGYNVAAAVACKQQLQSERGRMSPRVQNLGTTWS